MVDKMNSILVDGEKKISGAKTIDELKVVKSLLLGKQGAVTDILKELPRLEGSQRAEVGRSVGK